MNSNGQLYFPDHEKNFWKTDSSCSCGKVLANWRAKQVDPLPQKMRIIMQRKNAIFANRKRLSLDYVKKNLNERLYAYKTKKALDETINALRFKKISRILNVTYNFRDLDNEQDLASVYVFKNFVNLNSLPFDWYERVYLKGMAIINNNFVADIRENPKNKRLEIKLLDFSADNQLRCNAPKKQWRRLKETKDGKLMPVIPRTKKSAKFKFRKELFSPFCQNRVFCNNEMHTVGINSKGQFYFKNHSEDFLKTEGLVKKFGGVACGCYSFF